MSSEQTPSRPQDRFTAGVNTQQELSPELVRKVADRVYALLLRDLAIGRERRRNTLGVTLRGDE